MPISHKYKVIFIHVPKCAGTSIEHLLDIEGDQCFFTMGTKELGIKYIPKDVFTVEEYTQCTNKNMQHYTLIELSKILQSDIFNTYKKISVVRNPYSRLVSEYNFRKTLYTPAVTTFVDLVKERLNLDKVERNKIYDGHLETQTSFLTNKEGNFNSIDKIYKFENLNECIEDINKLTGKKELPHLRTSKINKPWQEYYTPELKELVYNFYKEDFVNFGYTK